MFVICDQQDVVQDIATEEANLSRGHDMAGARLYVDVDAEDIQIGDTYKDGKLTKNTEDRQKAAESAANDLMIRAKMRRLAIDVLIAEEKLPPDYTES